MSKGSLQQGNICKIDIAGIVLSINSYGIEIPRMLSPVYRLFLVQGDFIDSYQLNIILYENEPLISDKDDPHPELIHLKDKIILNFSVGKLIGFLIIS